MRMHVNYAEYLLEKMLLVLIDAHSKRIEVQPVESATTKNYSGKVKKNFFNSWNS